jgi:hypothetical protein
MTGHVVSRGHARRMARYSPPSRRDSTDLWCVAFLEVVTKKIAVQTLTTGRYFV